jgi:hypothetical protein
MEKTPNAQETKVKVSKWDYIKFKSFCTPKEIINSEETTYRMGGIFTNYIYDNMSISEYTRN